MEVTKCDRCGEYVDKYVGDMPILIYAYSREKYTRGEETTKNICYECYNRFLDWVTPFGKENKEENNDKDN